MQLTELSLNRNLYKEEQTMETKDAVASSVNSSALPSNDLKSGNSVQDVNSNAELINGAVIDPGTIPPATLDISNWGWTQNAAFSVTDADTVTWSAGTFTSANGAVYTISGGNTGNMAAKTYVYLDINVSSTVYQVTTNPATAVGVGKVLIAVCENGAATATYILVQATQIVGDNVLANSINASKIVAGSITATQISALYIYAGTINADQINAGTLTGRTVRTAASSPRVEMSAATNSLMVYDSAGTVIEIGTSGGSAMIITPTSVTQTNGILVASTFGGFGYNYTNSTNVTATAYRAILDSTGGSNTGAAFHFTKKGAGQGILGTFEGSSVGLYLQNSGTGSAIVIEDSGTSGTIEGISFQYARAGKAISITTSNAAATGLYITSVSTSNAAIDIVINTASGNPVGIRMSVTNAGGNEYAFDFQGGEIVSSAVGGTQDKKIRVLIGGSGGSVYYLPLYDA